MQEESITTRGRGQIDNKRAAAESFEELISEAEALDVVAELGFTRPTNLQAQTIPAIAEGNDLILQGEHDSGKTMAWIVGLLSRRGRRKEALTAIVIVDSSEAARGIKNALSTAGLAVAVGVEEGADATVTIITADNLEGADLIQLGKKDLLVIEQGSSPAPAALIEAAKKLLSAAASENRPQLLVVAENPDAELAGLVRTANQKTGTAPSASCPAEHIFYQLGGELLSKPNALSAVIEAEGRPATLIFCNLPSDTDLVEAMLNKHGIRAVKIIGNVPQQRVNKTVRTVLDGEYTALVATDVGARFIEVEEFALVINYSIPEDPEVYIHRAGHTGSGGTLHKILSFVNPFDVTNFHYLRKICGFKFQEGTLPSNDEISIAQFENLKKEACQLAETKQEDYQKILERLSAEDEESREKIVTLLIHNSFTILPALKNELARHSSARRHDDHEDQDRDYGRERHDREDRSRGGDRRGRDRRDERGQDEGRHDDRGHNRSRGRYDNQEVDRSDWNDRGHRQAPRVAPIKDARLYLGHGTKDGFSEQELHDLFSKADIEATVLKRFSMRGCYAFADVAEESAQKVIDGLKGLERSDGSRIFVTKATTLTAPREEVRPEEDNHSGAQDLHDGDEGNGGSDDYERN